MNLAATFPSPQSRVPIDSKFRRRLIFQSFKEFSHSKNCELITFISLGKKMNGVKVYFMYFTTFAGFPTAMA